MRPRECGHAYHEVVALSAGLPGERQNCIASYSRGIMADEQSFASPSLRSNFKSSRKVREAHVIIQMTVC
jgi:hypothetical protein